MRITRQERNAVILAAQNLPTVQQFLDHPAIKAQPRINSALEGIWCGSEGRVTAEVADADNVIVVGWYRGRVEYAYIS